MPIDPPIDAAGGRGSEPRRPREFLEFAEEAGGFGVFDLDLETRRLTGSALFFELIELPAGDLTLTQQQWLATLHPEDFEPFVARFEAAVARGGEYAAEYRVLRTDGGVRWLDSRGRVQLDAAGHARRLVGTITDITARRRLEQTLHETREALGIALEAAGVATFDDDRRRGPLLISDNLRTLLDLDPDVRLPTRAAALEHVHPDDRERAGRAPLEATRAAPEYKIEYRVLLEDGEVRWIGEQGTVRHAPDGSILRVTGAVIDITDRKRAESALELSQKRLARSVLGTQDGLWELDLDAHKPWFSERFEELLGYARGELNAARDDLMQRLIHPDDRERRHAAYERCVRGEAGYDIELRLLHAAGHYEWARSRAQLERDAAGRPVWLAGSIQLITERKLAERESIEARLAAEAANRAKSRFLANVSHEIRTPMNGVIGVAQLLGGTTLDATQREYLGVIRSSANALLSLINDVLDFSKIEANRLELERVEFGLHDLLYDAAAAVAAQSALKGIELVVDVARGVPRRAHADPGRLRQILMNLLGNAVKFTHEGHVALRVSSAPAADGEFRAVIEVQDTGIGIPADRRDRLFQSFSQVDSSTTRLYGGTGLGLSIVKRLAELMGGQVGVTSEPGRGSTFRVGLTLGTADDEARPPPIGRGRRLLVVDDLAASRDALAAALADYGFEVEAVDGVEAALDRLACRAPFCAVLADEWMPRRGGLDLLAAMRAQARFDATRFVLLSLFGAEPPDPDSAHQPDAVCMKPIRGSALARTIDRFSSADAPSAVEAPARAAAEPSYRGRRVLIAEDNPVNQRIARRMLERLAIEAVVTGNGEEALERLAAEPFDAVLMDCQMPVMDGFLATARIREAERRRGAGARLPVIALSANVTPEDRERCTAAGMDAHLCKPLDAEQLHRCLERFFDAHETSPAVDLGALRTLTDGDAAFERELIDTFIASGDRNLAEIRDALRNNDFDVIGRRAHALKSASANIHAAALSSVASDLESAVRAQAVGQIDALVRRLADQFDRVNRELREAG